VSVRLASSKSKVKAMAKSESEKDRSKEKPKAKPAAQAGADAGKKAKAKPAAEAAAEAPAKEKPPAAPRPPADPRLKYMKKFHGKFLPRGPLRDRHTALMTRWNSGEDHGGVTAEELKSLYDDWKAVRIGRRRPATTSA
jgi:hypothetical protein